MLFRSENFSPNVLLRPLYQESILPNLAYVGGGSEISYWLELKDLFIFYKIPFPILSLRCSLLLLNKKDIDQISRNNLSVSDFFEQLDFIEKKYMADPMKMNDTNPGNKLINSQYKHRSKSLSPQSPIKTHKPKKNSNKNKNSKINPMANENQKY